MNPLILALDTNEISIAEKWIEATHSVVPTFKVGLEFYLAFGSAGLDRLRKIADFDLFLDLKLHDIPNTVEAAVRAVAHHEPRFLTVHAAGGAEMIERAAKVNSKIGITAVTVLTSLSAEELPHLGFAGSPTEIAQKMATNAVNSGAAAIVSSPLEVAAIRSVAPSTSIITPGVRPIGSEAGDQKRVMTPADAIAAGSTHLVIGRPITSLYRPASDDSLTAMRERAQEIVDSLR